MTRPALALSLAIALLPACQARQLRVSASGSSTVYPISEAMAEEFGKTRGDVQVAVGVTGTGGGFKRFCAGETDLSDASRPIKASELEQCQRAGVQFVELPVAYDGIAVVVNPANTWASDITVPELKKLWAPEAQRTVTRWSQVRAGWPDKEIHLFGPGVDSGTYDYFTEAIVGKEHASRGDYTAAVDPNVLATGVANDELALGFFGMAYFQENKDKLKALGVDDLKAENGAGPILPSAQTVRDGTYQPLSRPVFIYVALRSLERPEVAAFVDFYLHRAPLAVEGLGFVALPPRAYALGKQRADQRLTGSIFGGKGSQVGVSINELLEKAAAPR